MTANNIPPKNKICFEFNPSNETIRALFKNIPIPTFVWKKIDNDLVLVDYNDAAVEITEGRINEILGDRIDELYSDMSEIRKELLDCFNQKMAFEKEKLYRFKTTGEIKYLSVKYVFVPPDLVLVHTQDITLRKKAEEKLKHSEKRYRELAYLLPQTIFETDDAYNITYSNRAGFNSFGYSSEDMQNGLSVFDLIVAEEQEKAIQNIIKVMKGESSRGNEYTAIRKDGTTFHSLIYSSPMVHDGKVIGLRGIVVDISKLKESQLALQLSERRFELLYEENPTMYFTIDLKGKILSVNKFGTELLGFSVEELLGESIYTAIYEEDKKMAQQRLNDIGTNKKDIDSWELRKVCKNGKIVWVRESARHIRDDDGKSLILIVCEDISDKIQAQKEREKLTKQLSEREKLALLGQFTAAITHEINNPLDIIMTDIDALQDDHYHLPELLIYTEKIKEQVFKINRLVRDILSYIKPHPPELHPVDVNKVLVQTIELLQGYHRDGIKIETKLKPNLPLITADAIGLEIVFKNIILNAIQSFKQEGKIKIVTQLIKDDQLRVSIKDNGPGIEKSRLSKVFEQFHSGKKDTGGTGLGLAISLEIVKKHHGTINVKSRLGEGTTFNVNLPVHSTA